MRIELNDGTFTVVDDDDAARVSHIRWYRHSQGYATGWESDTKTLWLLHRLITRATAGFVVDHISGNKLDNRKANLRVTNMVVNGHNRSSVNTNNTSGVNGVTRHHNRWCAHVRVSRKIIWLGAYESFDAAADAVRKAKQEIDAGNVPCAIYTPRVYARGENTPNHKLTDQQVAEIRARRAAGEFITTLGRAFNVNSATISRVARGLSRSKPTQGSNT